MTTSERKIATVLLENQNLVETHTATELAQLAGVSKATTARFFRTLGYSEFEEVRLQAREERNRREPYTSLEALSDSVSQGRALSDHVEMELRNLTRTFEELRSDLLADIATILESAPRVWFLGFGDEEGVARVGRSLFRRLRHNVHQIEGKGENWAQELLMTGPRDALIFLSFEPRPKLMHAVLAHARTTRMQIITITDHAYLAQARRFSDIVLPCHIANYGILPTHATMISMIRLIAIAFIGKNAETVTQRMAILDEINEELNLSE